MSYDASFFDAMSGVKKLTNFMHAITCQIPACRSSFSSEYGRSQFSPMEADMEFSGDLMWEEPSALEPRQVFRALCHPSRDHLSRREATVGAPFAEIRQR